MKEQSGNMFDFIARANPQYVESLYREYQRDPSAVDERWALVFAGYDFARRDGASAPADAAGDIADLVHQYRDLGHLIAELDPLGTSPRAHPLLALEEFGLSDRDLARVVDPGGFKGLMRVTLRELVEALRETYCRTLGVEYMGIPQKEKREWLRERMEPARNRPSLTADDQRRVLERLIEAETFEQFLHAKYIGQKRFSLEGSETLIPLLDEIIEHGAALEAREFVLGMPHRGRLNALAHVLRKPYEMILAEFEGTFLPWDIQGDGDVKYHLGYSCDHQTRRGATVHLSLSPNPSHLEAIDPVVEGIVRAKQSYLDDRERRRIVPVLLHGDASFMGQGLVYETMALSGLPDFTTGGTVHVIINNQIGFTTAPEEYRFTHYPSDPAKMLCAPVFHVNGDDPEAAVQAARLAVGFRQAFRTDVFIDLVCYRRHGHNEVDDPTFTQPVMYEKIRTHPTVTRLYAERLAERDTIDRDELARRRDAVRTALDGALASAREHMPRQKVFAFGGVWQGLSWAGEDWSAETAIPEERLRAMAGALYRAPTDFTPHKRLVKLLDERREMVERGEGLDWGCAELLAYASLLVEGTPVRLSGQDTARGTFSHRHAVLHDAQTGAMHVPLNHLEPGQAEIEIVNSPLSEAGVLGFEYGMSSGDPRRLVIWEAQFGDFANGGQVVIDQFIASGESKWQRMSGLTLLLPHGYEGQGPEHSSARLERFLSLCADGNIQVVNCTTPAQFFHVLRRQMHRRFRKPLVVMSPKSLLRHPRATSSLGDLARGSFRSVLPDPRALDPAHVERLVFCSGKIFYALDHGRDERDWQSIAIARIEELYPFPEAAVRDGLERYPHTTDVCWVQEEPANQGAWSFVMPRLERLLDDQRHLRYVGREEAASPATGSYKLHQSEEDAIVEAALKRPRPPRQVSSRSGEGNRQATA
jgi:2-oxoglutarate dehydrogenase E1 component